MKKNLQHVYEEAKKKPKNKKNKTKQNKKPLDPSDSNYSCKGTMARTWRENKSIYKLLSNFTKTYSCQKTYKKTANKRFHYILPFLLLRH